MEVFVSSIHHWLLSVWSHHPVTWQNWAAFAYVVFATTCLFVVVLGKKLSMKLLTITGLTAVLTGIGAATEQDSFHFWSWLVIGGILLSRPIYNARQRSKAKKAVAKAKATAKVPVKAK